MCFLINHHAGACHPSLSYQETSSGCMTAGGIRKLRSVCSMPFPVFRQALLLCHR